MEDKDLKRKIQEVVLEELEKKNPKLVKLVQEHEKRYDDEINEDVESFINESIDLLMEYLSIEKKIIKSEESELEKMRRLIG